MTAGARRCRRGAAAHGTPKRGRCIIVPSWAQVARWLAKWSGRPDSNWRPPAPHAGALPGCATPRPDSSRISHSATGCNSVAQRHFRHAPASDFGPRRGRKRGNAGELRSRPYRLRAARSRPRILRVQPRVSVRQLPIPYRIRSTGSGKIQSKLCRQRALKIPPAPIR